MTTQPDRELPESPIAPAPASAAKDESTQLARRRTSLALERSFLAFERTLMAWLRTSLSMISFGFTLAKFFEFLEDKRGAALVGKLGRTWAPSTVGIAMIVIGTGALVLATIQHWRRVKALRREGLVPQWNLTLHVAVLVAILGVFALGTLVF